MIEGEYAAGTLSGASWRRYLLQMAEGHFYLKVPEPLRPGKPLRFDHGVTPARRNEAMPLLRIRNEGFAIDGVAFDVPPRRAAAVYFGISMGIWDEVEVPAAVRDRLIPGPHTLRYSFDSMIEDTGLAILAPGSSRPILDTFEGPSVTLEATFELVEESTESAKE